MKTLVILAGGKSTRMGKDKVFLRLNRSETFLESLYHNAALFFDRIIISAGSTEHAKQIAGILPEAVIIPDEYLEIGPMGGLVSVYEKTGIEKFSVVPTDVPFADMEILSFFFEHCGEDACLMKHTDGSFEPLIGAYGNTILEKMRLLIQEGCYKIRLAFSDRTVYYSTEKIQTFFPEKTTQELEKAFRNINTAEDYRKYIK